MSNKCCRIFEEQVKLLLSLPNQQEAKTVLYQAIINSYNQFENQNEIQNENAYVSVSVSDSESISVLSKSILELLSKNIVWKSFSNNYGGKRDGAGRRIKNQIENQIDLQSDNQKEERGQVDLAQVEQKNKEFSEEFEIFWKEYPKQRAGNKQKAYTSYCRAIKEKRTTVDDLLKSVRAYKQSDEVKRGFAKGCQAWLNDDRFNVEYKVEENQFSHWSNW